MSALPATTTSPATAPALSEAPRLKTRQGGIVRADRGRGAEGRPASLATRRYRQRRKRRRRRILIGVAVALAVFPPMWGVYLIAWLVWRSRPPQQSMRHVRRGIRALDKDQTGVALKHLQEAHYLDTSNLDALYWLGLILAGQARHEEASEALAIVADRIPGLPEVEAALVDACVATGEADRAVYHAQRLLDVAPYDPATLLKLADAFEAAGRPALAMDALRQAPLHKRTLTDALLGVHYRLGTLLEAQGDHEQALHHYERVYGRDLTYRDIKDRIERLDAEAR